VTVSDGLTSVSDTFTLTVVPVNDVPTLTPPADVAIDEDATTGALAFTIGDVETDAGALEVTASSSNEALVPASGLVLGGSGADRTITVTPAADAHGTAVITLSVGDGAATTTAAFTVTVNAVNDLPVVTPIADQAIDEDTATPPLAFTIGDVETPVEELAVSVLSSDTNVVAAGGLTLAGDGASRTLVVRPVADASGTTTITVSVGDGSAVVTSSFVVTVAAVNDAPTVSAIADKTVLVNERVTIPFAIGDVDHDPAGLVVTATSSNTALVRDGDIVVGGSGADRTLAITPRFLQHGKTTITVTVSDGDKTATETFVLTVNFAPWISPIGDVGMRRGRSETLPFFVVDVETPPAALVVTAISSNPAVVPPQGLVLASLYQGFMRTLTIQPAAAGTADITLTVFDGSHSRSTTFTVTVR